MIILNIIVIALVICSLAESGFAVKKAEYRTIYLDEKCGSNVTLKYDEALRIQLSRSENGHQVHTWCNVTLTLTDPDKRLQMRILELNTDHEQYQPCGYLDKLEIYSLFGDEQRLVGQYCGNYVLEYWPIEVDMNRMKISFYTSNRSIPPYGNFDLIVTPFHEGLCEANVDFGCSSPRCISEKLQCDGYDNCGDAMKPDRDEDPELCKKSGSSWWPSWEGFWDCVEEVKDVAEDKLAETCMNEGLNFLETTLE